MKNLLKRGSALVSVAALIQSTIIAPALAATATTPSVTLQPNLQVPITSYAYDPVNHDPVLPNSQMIQLLRQKIKYVFVIFNENESFDHEYGTFPGANGLYADQNGPRSAANTPGFNQTYTDVNGNSVTVQPFRIGPQQNSTFVDSVDHSHTGLAKKIDVIAGQPQMDGFSKDEYSRFATSSASSAAAQAEGTQFARVVMSHIDCDTIPIYWKWANRFTLFDNIFATEDTPSTPNAIAMIAGQAGETQWVKHGPTATPNEPISGTINGTTYSGTSTPQGVPVVNDPQPFWGSAFDTTTSNREPTGPKESWAPTNTNENLTFATVPLTLAGNQITSLLSGDKAAASDQADIQNDIPYIAANTTASVGWRWYQNGYGINEPSEPSVVLHQLHANYVSHHNGAQYFGYLANNSNEQGNMRGEYDFFNDFKNNNLPANGGVIYIRGGYYNIQGWKPPIQNPNYPDTAGLTAAEITTINNAKSGDDDHPSYSDRQISSAMNARVINAIAESPIWSQSAIIITYDESDGYYDHVPPRILSYGPDGLPLSRGVRIPLILISPYARAGSVAHAEGDHNAVIQTINAIFGLPALSSLPDEKAALTAGNSAAFNEFAAANGPANFQQQYLGPRDTNSPITDSLLSGFSPLRLQGKAAPIPGNYAVIPPSDYQTFPHYGGNGCATIGVTPTDANLPNTLPGAGTSHPFNTLPSTLPAYN